VWLDGKPRQKYYKRIYAVLHENLRITDKHFVFCTLTYDTKKYSQEGTALAFPEHIKEFFRLLRKKIGKVEYFWIIELTKAGYVHCHIILDRYVHWTIIKAIWYRITGSYITNIESIPANNIVSYVCKYLSKQQKQSEDQFRFIFKNVARLWSSSRNFFSKRAARNKEYIFIGMSWDLYYSSEHLFRPDPDTELWEVEIDRAIPLLLYGKYIQRKINDKAYEFIDSIINLASNQIQIEEIAWMENFFYPRCPVIY